MIINSTPKEDCFFMPAEYAPHRATIMIWPERAGSWIYGAKNAKLVFTEIIKAISVGEKVYVAVSESAEENAKEILRDEIKYNSVKLLRIDTNDCWVRDISPTFVVNGKQIRGVDWRFNAWGGDFNGLYSDWKLDDEFALTACAVLGLNAYSARPFVLEGGSFITNGAGTVVTTEECLLSKGRNPGLSKSEIEGKLKEYLDCERVIWLPYGLAGDKTNGHVDNMCAFVGKSQVVLSWDEEGEQSSRCRANLEVLETNGINVITLPIPKQPITVTEHEAKGFKYEKGDIRRKAGERLVASYVNFYICNSSVLVPQYGDKNDRIAVHILGSVFKDRKIVPIYARDILVGGGSIHGITQQIPQGTQFERRKNRLRAEEVFDFAKKKSE